MKKVLLYILILFAVYSCKMVVNSDNKNETPNKNSTIDKELKKLYDEFIAEGFNQFYIEGIGGPTSDGIEILGLNNGKWEISYIERGKKSTPTFSSQNKKVAIDFYKKHVYSIKHHHLAVLTRSEEKATEIKMLLDTNNIEFWQNDILSYAETRNKVYRLFVFNKDIFRIKKLGKSLPLIEKLK